MTIPIYQVDAFSGVRFHGNPAAVCILDQTKDDAWMQSLAAEMNLSETAFVQPKGEAWKLRWFTPTVEVDLCGHATLASAHVLWERGALGERLRFETRSGELQAVRREGWIELDFPALPSEPAEAPPGLLEALGVEARSYARSLMFDLVEVASEKDVREARPDFERLAALDAPLVIVTSRSGEYDFVSRCFCGAAGIPEDPVTGSAHCCLGPYWGAKLERTEMTGYQASARGGIVRVRLEGDRVKLAGKAVTVLRGELV